MGRGRHRPPQVAIVTYPGMTGLDAIGPYEVLRFVPGAEVRFVWHEPGPITADSGVLILGATHSFAETPTPDIVVVPGGAAAITIASDDALLTWLRGVHETASWTTSVCTGSLILASAGLLDDAPAVTHWLAMPILATLGARPMPHQRIVRTGRIATAAGASAGIDLALWIVGDMYGADRARTIQLDIEYDPQPPYDAGHPTKASRKVRLAATADQAHLIADLVRPAQVVRTATAIPQVLWRNAIRRARKARGTQSKRPAD